MAKLIEINGEFFRMRRGVLVKIPPQWVGKVTTQKTIRRRPSKVHRKLRRIIKNEGVTESQHRYREAKDALKGGD